MLLGPLANSPFSSAPGVSLGAGVAAFDPVVGPYAGGHALDSFTGLSIRQSGGVDIGQRGVTHGITGGKLAWRVTGSQSWEEVVSGVVPAGSVQFCATLDYSVAEVPNDAAAAVSGAPIILRAIYSTGDAITVRLNSTGRPEVSRSLSGVPTVTTAAATVRTGRLCIRRGAGNAFVVSYLAQGSNTWVTVESFTAAYPSEAPTIVVGAGAGGGTNATQGQMGPLVNLLPSAAALAASAAAGAGGYEAWRWDADTVHGFRGFGGEVPVPPAAVGGTATFQYRTGSTEAERDAAEWVTLADGPSALPVADPSPASRYASVRCMTASLSATAPVPDVSLPRVYSAADQGDLLQLVGAQLAAALRHRDPATGRAGIYQTPFATLSSQEFGPRFLDRMVAGLCCLINAGVTGVTHRGTAYDLVTVARDLINSSVGSSMADGQRAVEAYEMVRELRGAAADAILAAMTGAQRTAWNNWLSGSLSAAITNVNYNLFRATIFAWQRYASLRYAATYPGVFTSRSAADIDPYIDAAYAQYAGGGVFNDAVGAAQAIGDSYSQTFAAGLAYVGLLFSGYRAARIRATLLAARANILAAVNEEGVWTQDGRSINGAAWWYTANLLPVCEYLGTLGTAAAPGPDATPLRECASASLWSYIAYNWSARSGLGNNSLGRNAVSAASYSEPVTLNGFQIGAAAQFAGTLALFAAGVTVNRGPAAQADGLGERHVVPGAAMAYVRGPGVPRLGLNGLYYDHRTDAASAAIYNQRILVPPFAMSVGAAGGRPNFFRGYPYTRLAAGSGGVSGNIVHLSAASAARALRVGRGVAVLRQGPLRQFSSSGQADVSGATATEAYCSARSTPSGGVAAVRAVALSRMRLGASSFDFISAQSLPVPLSAGVSAASQQTDATGRWAAQRGSSASGGASGQLSHMIRLLESPAGATLSQAANQLFGTEAEQLNERDFQGRAVTVSATATLTGVQDFASVQSYARGALVPATEAGYVSGWASANSGAGRTWSDADGGAWWATLQYGSGSPVTAAVTAGQYTVTTSGGGEQLGYRFPSAAGDNSWGGGGDCTGITHATLGQQVTAASPVAVDWDRPASDRLLVTTTGGLTLHPGLTGAGLPTASVRRIELDGTRTDVSASCTITPGTGGAGATVVIPGAVVDAGKPEGVTEGSRLAGAAVTFEVSADSAAPTVTAATVAAGGLSGVITFGEAMASVGAVGDWSLSVAGSPRALATLTRAGDGLSASYTLSGATPVYAGQAVTLAYDGTGAEDLAGNDLAELSGFAVTNSSAMTASVESVTVSAAGGATSVQPGATLQMSAAVSPVGASQSVTWGVEGDTSGGASISAGGLLTVGPNAGSVTVRATSTAAPGVSGTYAVTVVPVVIDAGVGTLKSTVQNAVQGWSLQTLLAAGNFGAAVPVGNQQYLVFAQDKGTPLALVRAADRAGGGLELLAIEPATEANAGVFLARGAAAQAATGGSAALAAALAAAVAGDPLLALLSLGQFGSVTVGEGGTYTVLAADGQTAIARLRGSGAADANGAFRLFSYRKD